MIAAAGAVLVLCTLGAPSILFGLVSLSGLCGRRPDRKNSPATPPPPGSPVSILIPAHNERRKIALTLATLHRELLSSGTQARIHIGLDQCDDDTEEAIEPWASLLSIRKYPLKFGSKWKTLQYLLQQCGPESEWVILLDAGTIWDTGLLEALGGCMTRAPDIAVLAPSYRIENGSRTNKLFWWFESGVKTMENHLGGPISVHGATVAFRRAVLQDVFERLSPETHPRDFRNDDVILPLATRVFFPASQILYLRSTHALDQSSLESPGFRSQWRRRKRLVLGNLQWTRWLLQISRSTPIPPAVWCVSIRRILRPFWLESLLLLALGLLLDGHSIAAGTVLLPAAAFPSAALASALAPVAWIFRRDQKPSAWR